DAPASGRRPARHRAAVEPFGEERRHDVEADLDRARDLVAGVIGDAPEPERVAATRLEDVPRLEADGALERQVERLAGHREARREIDDPHAADGALIDRL